MTDKARIPTTDPDRPAAPDYARLIAPDTWAFIRDTERWYPPETASFTIAEQRQVYDRMCRAFARPYPAGLAVHDQMIGGVPCRIYTPVAGPAATVLYLHGGGFVVGGLDSHDPVCAELAAATGLRVVSADYRLAPEHRHPAHFVDAWAATVGAASLWPGPLVMAGDSAGAALAASVTHKARASGPMIAGQLLIYPGLGGPLDRGSALTHANAPMLTRDDVLFYRACRYVDGVEPDADPTATALRDSDFSRLPPTLIFAAACDPLADDGPAYAQSLTAAGGRAFCRTEAGLPHGYLRGRHDVTGARDSFAHIADGLAHLARGDWPTWAAPPREGSR